MPSPIDFQNAERQRRYRARKRNGKIPLKIEVNEMTLLALLIEQGFIDADDLMTPEREKIRAATEALVTALIDFIGNDKWQKMKEDEFVNLAKFIMLNGGSSNDPETLRNFFDSEFSVYGKIRRLMK